MLLLIIGVLYYRCNLQTLLKGISINTGYPILHVKQNKLLATLFFLRDHFLCSFCQFNDLTVKDMIIFPRRFSLYWSLVSILYNTRLFVHMTANEFTPVSSIAPLFAAAEWAEREVYDLFGILIQGNTHLRRILTDYGFEGYPLRKDFPVVGYYDVIYSEVDRQLIRIPASLAQEYRLQPMRVI